MRSLVVFAAFLGAVSGAGDAAWNYNDPETWSTVNADCGGQRQSPIDIDPYNVHYHADLASLKMHGYDQELNVTLWNKHFAIGADTPAKAAYITGGGLPDPTGQYELLQFHFHWGSNAATGSEHRMGGKAYPMEVHFVHYNNKYADVPTAAANADGLAVLGVLVEIGEENEALEDMIDNVHNIQYSEDIYQMAMSEKLQLDKILPSDTSRFFRYDGSLTTPNCQEAVTWTVFEHTIQVSAEQLAKIRDTYQLKQGTANNPLIGQNFRPLQPLNGRKVYFSQPTTKKAKAGGYSYFPGLPNGPSNWASISKYGNMCDGKKQSPINIVKDDAVPKRIEAFRFTDYDAPMDLALDNGGHGPTLRPAASTASMSGGGLPGDKFALVNFHFHFGSTDNTGSEHTMNGNQYPLEIHWVHFNTKYDTVTDALIQPDGLAVLGFFYEISDEDNEHFAPFFDAVSKVLYKGSEPVAFAGVRMDTLLGDTSKFFRYPGSLTTPGCNEAVTWSVFEEPLKISVKQLTQLRQMYMSAAGTTSHPPQLLGYNYRPVQPLNGRTVYYADTTGSGSASPRSVVSMLFVAVVAAIVSGVFTC